LEKEKKKWSHDLKHASTTKTKVAKMRSKPKTIDTAVQT